MMSTQEEASCGQQSLHVPGGFRAEVVCEGDLSQCQMAWNDFVPGDFRA